MADLIIKPLTGAGNTVRIQDQAGGAILTSADSGATLGSGVDLTGVTVPAAGITGTLGSGITFPAGHVIQVVEGTHATEQTTTSTSFVDTTIDVTITPSSASSKILVIASTHTHINGGAPHVGYYTIYRDSTNLGSGAGFASVWHGHPATGNNDDNLATHVCFQKLDSPNTTSPVEYSIYVKSNNTSYTCYWSMNGSTSVITAMEISG
jgi:hypothetical protein